MIKIAPSILSADFSDLAKEINMVEKAGADWIHLDVMDGHFVPNITFGAPVIKSIRKCTNLFFDAHLMIEEPELFIDDFVDAGVNSLTIHPEAGGHTLNIIHEIKDKGAKAAIAINPGTSVEVVKPYLESVDMILVMSVNPGFGGQSFISSSIEKISRVKAMIKDSGRKDEIIIQVDGGINNETAPSVIDAGADVLVSGSYIFNKEGNIDEKEIISAYEKHIKSLRA